MRSREGQQAPSLAVPSRWARTRSPIVCQTRGRGRSRRACPQGSPSYPALDRRTAVSTNCSRQFQEAARRARRNRFPTGDVAPMGAGVWTPLSPAPILMAFLRGIRPDGGQEVSNLSNALTRIVSVRADKPCVPRSWRSSVDACDRRGWLDRVLHTVWPTASSSARACGHSPPGPWEPRIQGDAA